MLNSPTNLSLASTVLGWNRSRMPLAPTSDHPPTFFPVATFGISHSAVHYHRDQPPFVELNSLLTINHELSVCQDYSTQVEAAVHCLVNMHLRVSYTSLSLDCYFDRDVWLWRVWATFSCELAKEKGVRCKASLFIGQIH